MPRQTHTQMVRVKRTTVARMRAKLAALQEATDRGIAVSLDLGGENSHANYQGASLEALILWLLDQHDAHLRRAREQQARRKAKRKETG